ncbi:MAG: hypothetical protein ACPLTR_10435, partial [Thermacetogeniaceae bacterium]
VGEEQAREGGDGGKGNDEAQVVQKDYALIQAEALNNEVIAVIKTPAARQKVPRGYVVYSEPELRELSDCNEEDLYFLHITKKLFNGEIIPVA